MPGMPERRTHDYRLRRRHDPLCQAMFTRLDGAEAGPVYCDFGAAASRSSILPDMIVRMCSVMCGAYQSHQATARRRAMSSSPKRLRMSLAGLPPTIP